MTQPKKKKFPVEVFVAINLDGDLIVGSSAEDAYDLAKIECREVVPIAIYKLDSLPILYEDHLVVISEKKKK